MRRFAAAALLCSALLVLTLSGCRSHEASSAIEALKTAGDMTQNADTETEPAAELSAGMRLPMLSAGEILNMPAETELSPERVSTQTARAAFCVTPVPDAVFARISGISYADNANVQRSDLRYLRCLHYDYRGRLYTGELICEYRIADDLLAIFSALYDAAYPIGSMRLIDDFGGSDAASADANNTYCFNTRSSSGTQKLSLHSYGLAVDINPAFNPSVFCGADGSVSIQPQRAEPYADRSASFPMKLTEDDLCVQLFTEHGFRWGGASPGNPEYQHFEKTDLAK